MKITRTHNDTRPHTVATRSYVIGFIASLVLTFGAYVLVTGHINGQHQFLTHQIIAAAVLALAFAQLVVQLVFFLHMGREQKPKWNLYAMWFTVLVVAILIAGSIWIMANMDYNMQLDRPSDIDNTIIKDEGFHTDTSAPNHDNKN